MSEIIDEWSNQQPQQQDDVDFDGNGTTPPRPLDHSEDAQNNRQHTAQLQQRYDEQKPPPSDYSGSYSQFSPNENSQASIVHVSHMHVGVDDQLLTEHMSSSGKVLKVVIMLDPHTRESRGFGFVTFENPSEADDAIEKLHLSQILGKTITVARARRGRPRDPTPGQYIGPPKYDRSMSARPPKPRYQPYPSPREHTVDRYDRYERGPPRYAGRYHPYPDRYDRYGSYPPPRDYRDYAPPPRDYYGGAPYKPYPRSGPPPGPGPGPGPYKPYRPMAPRDRYDDYRTPRDDYARGPPRDYARDYARDYPPRDDFERPPRRYTPRDDYRDGYRDDYRAGPPRDYPPRDYPPRDYPPRDYDRGFKRY